MKFIHPAWLQVLINLRTQFENIMKALKDPRSLVNSIFRRAQERIQAMVADAGLDLAVDADRAVFNFALQARCQPPSASSVLAASR